MFGEGSWAEMERGVRERNPALFHMLDIMKEDEQREAAEAAKRKWWQFWK